MFYSVSLHTASSDECCGWKSRHITPVSVLNEYSGYDAFLSEKQQITPAVSQKMCECMRKRESVCECMYCT